MNKPNPKEKQRLIEWEKIELAYMEGDLNNPSIPPTFQSLSDCFKVSRQAISLRAKREHWSDRRNAQRVTAIDKVTREKTKQQFKQIADSLTAISLSLDKTGSTLGKMLDDGTKERTIQTKSGDKTITEKLTPQDLKAITATLRNIAKSKRELLDKASIDALRYDHRTAMTNFAQIVAEIIKGEIDDPTQLQRMFEKIAEATRPRTHEQPEEISA